MINPPTDCFFMVQLQGVAAQLVASTLSASIVDDIREAILISEDYGTDIEAINNLDSTVDTVRRQLSTDLVETSTHNPLYLPASADELDAMLDGEPKADSFRFVGMDGNPFTLKTVTLSLDDEGLVLGRASCKPFDLPSYNELVAAQAKVSIN